MAVWLYIVYGCMVVFLFVFCVVVWLYGCMVVWLYGFTVAWLYGGVVGCMLVRNDGHLLMHTPCEAYIAVRGRKTTAALLMLRAYILDYHGWQPYNSSA